MFITRLCAFGATIRSAVYNTTFWVKLIATVVGTITVLKNSRIAALGDALVIDAIDSHSTVDVINVAFFPLFATIVHIALYTLDIRQIMRIIARLNAAPSHMAHDRCRVGKIGCFAFIAA